MVLAQVRVMEPKSVGAVFDDELLVLLQVLKQSNVHI